MLSQLLNEIEKCLQQLDHSCVDHLNPGLSSQKIQELFEKIPLHPTQDLRALYTWRNGSKDCEGITLGELAFFPGFYLMSLEESIQTYLELRETDAWGKSWFPIFASGGGDFYAMNLAPEAQGQILGFYVFEEETQVEYQSLKSMLATLKACYEQGIIFRNEQGYLDMDYRKHAEIAHDINPEVKIWLEFLKETEEE
ncbi:SMI1/KNR4 family protein [Streptococcus parasanguinis]|uniref:SMI1/KNR4 family protein n=1 Tax=Streptococcus parasanguinis TaxID=1318 RepID=UPI001EFB5995|nr:SMI1/KNR4 family protein [Streptococcus parasanguinis]